MQYVLENDCIFLQQVQTCLNVIKYGAIYARFQSCYIGILEKNGENSQEKQLASAIKVQMW